MIPATTIRTRCWTTHFCDGCDQPIRPQVEHLEHHQVGTQLWLAECMDCAQRNGRPEVADPDVAEQPLDLDGIA